MSKEMRNRTITSFFLIFLLILMHFYSFILVISLIVIAIISWIEFYALISKIIIKNNINHKLLRFFFKTISLLYLFSLVSLVFIIETNYLNLKIYLLYSILIAIMSDMGGLVFGKIFKGRKLTKISPNKTISGSVGSFIFSMLLIPIFHNELLSQNLLSMFIITICVSLISQLGDLFISFLKRKAKVKNTSDILPGHGGFLDRFDGLIGASFFYGLVSIWVS